MKSVKNLFLVFSLVSVCLFFYQCSQTPLLPNVSKNYSVAEVDSLYLLHRSEHKQHVSPPISLLPIFDQDFPNAKDVECEESSYLYRIEFEIGNDDYKAFYDKNNQLVFYRCEISRSDLPAVVKNAILNKYPNFKIDDVDVYNKANVLSYEVEIKKDKFKYNIEVSDAGLVLSEKNK